MQFLKSISFLICAFLFSVSANAQSGQYEALDQDDAMRVFSAPVGSSVTVQRNGKSDVIVKNTIVIKERLANGILNDISLFNRLPGFVAQDVLFLFGSDRLTESAQQYLDQVGGLIARSYQANPGLSLLIAGFTDAVGSAGYNQDLSFRRAYAVQLYLMQRAGLPSCLFNAVGFGENWDGMVVQTNKANALNRRVEIRSTDILVDASTGLPLYSCQAPRKSGPGTYERLEQGQTTLLQGGNGSGTIGHCSLSDGYKSLTISFKGFEPSEFLGHIQALWPKMTNYADHQLLEQQANLRLYSLQLTAPSCEILDDIALHMQRIGYSPDQQLRVTMTGPHISVEKL